MSHQHNQEEGGGRGGGACWKPGTLTEERERGGAAGEAGGAGDLPMDLLHAILVICV
jgi:hypothetical protein